MVKWIIMTMIRMVILLIKMISIIITVIGVTNIIIMKLICLQLTMKLKLASIIYISMMKSIPTLSILTKKKKDYNKYL